MTEQTDKNKSATSLGIREILKYLPHRYPFLMIDRIEDMVGEQSAVGIKNVTATESWVQGHFPNWPIMPGVLIIESMAQTATVLVAHNRQVEVGNQVVYFMALDKCRFRRPVVPGDQLRIEVQQITKKGNVWKYRAVARVDGEVAAECEYTAMNYKTENA